MATWAFPGLTGWVLEAGTSYRAPITQRGVSTVIPGQHGAIRPRLAVFDQPNIVLIATYFGKDWVRKSNELQRVLAAPDLLLTRTEDGATCSANVRVESVEVTGLRRGQFIRFQILLSVPGVFFTGSEIVKTVAKTATGVTLLLETDSTAPLINSRITIPCDPGATVAVQVTDKSSGKGIFFANPINLGIGGYVHIFPTLMRAWRNNLATGTDEVLKSGTEVSRGLDYPAPGILEVWPNLEGKYQLGYTRSGTLTNDVTITLESSYF